jgi:hypothetical protein
MDRFRCGWGAGIPCVEFHHRAEAWGEIESTPTKPDRCRTEICPPWHSLQGYRPNHHACSIPFRLPRRWRLFSASTTWRRRLTTRLSTQRRRPSRHAPRPRHGDPGPRGRPRRTHQKGAPPPRLLDGTKTRAIDVEMESKMSPSPSPSTSQGACQGPIIERTRAPGTSR